MDIIWLKRDVRLHDHAPIHHMAKLAVEGDNDNDRPLIILYNYEPDQLSEHSVHGSHVHFVNEGLIDLDRRLCDNYSGNGEDDNAKSQEYKFRFLSVCYAGVVFTFNQLLMQSLSIGGQYSGIRQILAHEETGNLKSFARDKAVRRWCRTHNIQFLEFNQTGVTRCLKDRDDYSAKFKAFTSQPVWPTPTAYQLECIRKRMSLVRRKRRIIFSASSSSSNDCASKISFYLHELCEGPINVDSIKEIPIEHRIDRIERQKGGETRALLALQTFLANRGQNYAKGISSPNTSWTSGSRLSPFLTWGHTSTRYVIHQLKFRQEELRRRKKRGAQDGPWLKSLAAFSSRIHWRSHFIQKLESEPEIEKRDTCIAYQHLRRGSDDWNEEFFKAWSTGKTGFPFVDACMRCLIRHGWLNFRMRAMLVSFATYNLWLDWKRIAPHLARLFLDYEPGIHYPQLQMQAGTTGINAMRVYNVTKQGKDQDLKGDFIRKYVPELCKVPQEHIHEPFRMSASLQEKYNISIVKESKIKSRAESFRNKDEGCVGGDRNIYPWPIVDEKSSAKVAKEKVAEVRRRGSTKRLADQVYLKHGSRRTSIGNADIKPKALSSKAKRLQLDSNQTTLSELCRKSNSISTTLSIGNSKFENQNCSNSSSRQRGLAEVVVVDMTKEEIGATRYNLLQNDKHGTDVNLRRESKQERKKEDESARHWNCSECTFLNKNPLALACIMCKSTRIF